jgi:hypothetical protein
MKTTQNVFAISWVFTLCCRLVVVGLGLVYGDNGLLGVDGNAVAADMAEAEVVGIVPAVTVDVDGLNRQLMPSANEDEGKPLIVFRAFAKKRRNID